MRRTSNKKICKMFWCAIIDDVLARIEQIENVQKDNQVLGEKIHDYQEIITEKKIDFKAIT